MLTDRLPLELSGKEALDAYKKRFCAYLSVVFFNLVLIAIVQLVIKVSSSSWWAVARQSLFDDTFIDNYRLHPFDYAILVPYFTVLIILSFYGLHRYHMIRGYWQYRKQMPTEAPQRFEQLPRVTIQLPIYNEQYVVEQLIEQISKMDYPHDLLDIQILDDSTDETHPFTERLVAEYKTNGLPIEYIHRTNRHGYKAGALQNGLRTAKGEVVAIFDADFLPPTDFLQTTVHFFADPKIGMVQTRWGYTNRHYNLLTEVQAMLLDGHFVLEHVARSSAGKFFNFNGTAGIMRISMIDDAGGWQHDTLTEDSDLSYRAQLKGWKFLYVPSIECVSELPVETYGFQVQQSRWANGLTQVAKRAFLFLPALMATGVALTIINSKAFLEAIFGYETSFVRTPKYSIHDNERSLRRGRYRHRSGWLPFVELATGTYFLGLTSFGIQTHNILFVPFFGLAAIGFFWVGASALWAEHKREVR